MAHSKDTYRVLLDTSFLIRLLQNGDPLHQRACEYFEHFLANGITMKVSTISIAEYCVRGDIGDLPLSKVQILPFNINHATTAGKFADILLEWRKNYKDIARNIIQNDVKLFAQAHGERCSYFVTSDAESAKMIEAIGKTFLIKFKHLSIYTPIHEFREELPLEFIR